MSWDSFPILADFVVLQVKVPLGLNSGTIHNVILVEY